MEKIDSHRIRVTSLGDLLLDAADRFPSRNALIFPDQRHTYLSLVTAAYQRARSLYGLGVRSGDYVGLLMANCPEYMELLLGCSFLGAVAVPMNARYKSAELAYVVADADLKVIVTSDLIADYADFGQLLQAAFSDFEVEQDETNLSLSGAPLMRAVVMLGAHTPPGMLSQRQFSALADQVDVADIDVLRSRVRLEQPAIMMYTSGTTANPKGCPLSHGLLVRNGINMNRERYFMTEQDVFWAPLPMFHMAAILPFIACMDAAAAMSSMTHVESGLALKMLERDQVTIAFPSFPTVTNGLIAHPDFATTDLSKLRRINNVAPVEMLRRFQETFAQAVQTGAYGLTEAGGVIAFNHPDESLDSRLHTCGRPFPGIEVRIKDPETLTDLPADQQGELWVRGYCVFSGYHKSPEKNAESFVDGWLRTGDLCSLTEEGAICYHGRIKDMLKVGGENVAALEIESFLSKHPAVQLAQVIGREDERLQEVPIAFIELSPGQEASEAQLIEFCKGALASFKVPRAIYFVQEWPMSSTKVQKFRLRALI
ncbi:MAG: acyl--CoA ligase [Gammaproteobacteria bacterium]|nr:acyl--CoA ligase [Gammaproteobacteria bacterium]MCH1549979.1 acyl--CoA ligase [Pseudomonadales bacterium]